MNILILALGRIEKELTELCSESKLTDNVFTLPADTYINPEKILEKAKELDIDLAIINRIDLITKGIVDLFKKNKINIISVNEKWLNLETSRLAAKQLMNHYSINHPQTIKAPREFPIILKTNSTSQSYIANSMQELIDYTKKLGAHTVLLEDFMDGDIYELVSLWDGKNILFFDMNTALTEVQEERLELYKTKLHIMLSDENANFVGFICSKIMWTKNDWYVLDYKMTLDEKSDLSGLKSDFVYALNSAIYQKLNEIQ